MITDGFKQLTLIFQLKQRRWYSKSLQIIFSYHVLMIRVINLIADLGDIQDEYIR